jgi:hypothetical protein
VSQVLEDAAADETGQQRDFLCHLAMQSVEQKNAGKTFDRRYKLPKLKYMGAKIQTQQIRDIKAVPKIEEVNAPSKKTPLSGKAAATSAAATAPKAEPDKDLPFRLVWVKKQSPGGHDGAADAENALLPPATVEAPWGAANANGSDYTEPLAVPDEDVVGIALIADITGPAVAAFRPQQVDVRISPFKMQVKVPGFKLVSMYFPCAVAPPTATSTSRRPDGFVQRLEYCFHVQVDRMPWDAQVDAGSKPWLVAQALTMDEGASSRSSSSSAGCSSNSRQQQQQHTAQQQRQQQQHWQR